MKYKSLTSLIERLEEEGLPSSHAWLQNQLKSGRIALPKHKHANRYALTDEVIEDVIESLKKKGSYEYQKA